MSLTLGTLLGPYEILAPIGEGGMGDVYKARDTRLNRIVALKTSKTEFSERFEREARAVAALNHSHISQLYDVGPNYLVMEYIEGAPLKGPLPLDQALKYAAQICDALDAAHKKGITHRDLKPANILVTKTGIKLLDFGIAKMSQSTVTGSEDATVRMALTGNNEMVGTLYYMSPEQLQAQGNGQPVDARSDIFSFGIVLYEMLTGKRPFVGSSPATVIAAILERPAPSIAEVAPPALDRLLQRCLAKDPDDRWQSARDLKAGLEWIASASPQAATVPTLSSRHHMLPWIAASLAIAAAAIFGIGYYRATRPAELKPLVRLDVDLGPGVALDAVMGTAAIISPDGTRLVYVSRKRLFTRKFDQIKVTELPGTEGAFGPFFSPDGQSVAFFASGKLKKLSFEGGMPVNLCDAPNGRGGTWGDDGNIVVSLIGGNPIARIPSNGGTPTPLMELDSEELSNRWPQLLPGSKAVIYSSFTANGSNLAVISLPDHKKKVLISGGSFGRYIATPNGAAYLVYLNKGTLYAVAFDTDHLEVRGAPSPVLEHVGFSTVANSAQIDISQTGTLIYRSGAAANGGQVTVQWLDGAGANQPLLAKPGAYGRPHLSPDGQRLVLEVFDGAVSDAWIYEWRRDIMTRLTFEAGAGVMNPIWSPDGRYILFLGKGGIFWTRSDGAGKPRQLTQSKKLQLPMSFTPDGKRLAWNESSTNGAYDLWTLPLELDGDGLKGGNPEPFLQTSADERHPQFSPDGRWLAYSSNESGTYQVCIRAYPDKGGKWQVSSDGGVYPVWSKNGRELFFRSPDDRIMVAAYTVKSDSIVADKPRVWSERQLEHFGIIGFGSYDLAPDGKRVAALMPAEEVASQREQSQVIVLLNFFDELRRKVPAGGR